MEMTLNKYLEGKSIFTLIEQADDFPFLLGSMTGVFDTLMMYHYGSRIVFASVETMDVEQVAGLIASKYKDKWDKLVEAHSMNFELGTTTEKTTEIGSVDETKSGTGKDKDSVSAYDDVELVLDKQKDSETSQTLEGESEKVSTTEKKDINNVFDNLHLLQKNNIIEIVIRDVADFLTLSIY